MTIDEAIKHCLEVAEQNERNAAMSNNFDEWTETEYKDKQNCIQCAAEHRQLAGWLTVLKEVTKLLGSVIDEIYKGTSFNPTKWIYDNGDKACELVRKITYDTEKWELEADHEKP